MSEYVDTQRKPQNPGQAGLPGHVQDVVQRPGELLEQTVRQDMESQYAHDFSQVRVHTDPLAALSSRVLQAQAYTVGTDIAFARNRYAPSSETGRSLIAHELAHVVQQDRGSVAPGFAHEGDADRAAQQATSSDHGPVDVQTASAPGLALSVDDWMNSMRDVRSMTYSQIASDIDSIDQWMGRQNTTTPESMQLENALGELHKEKRRREKTALGAKKVKAKSKKRKKKNKGDENLEGNLEAPRILRERTSVQYKDAAEVNLEIDLIMAWLARDDISKADRSLLRSELDNLAPQFHQGRQQAKAKDHAERVQLAFSSPSSEGAGALEHVSGVLQRMVADPERPGVFIIFDNNEEVRISKGQVNTLRKNIISHFKGGMQKVSSNMKAGFGRYFAQLEVNNGSPVIASIAGFLGGSSDPYVAMVQSQARIISALARTGKAIQKNDFPRAARALATAERGANKIEAAGRAFSEEHIRGAGIAVKTLEITRDVSFAIAGSIAAIVAAPVVAASAAGAGLTGASAFAATTAGTGLIVGGGSAVVRGGSAGAGELAAGNSLEKAAEATVREGKRGAREGLVTGVTGGAAGHLTKALGVGKEGAKLAGELGKRALAEGSADFLGGATNAALEGKDVGEIFEAGGMQAAFGLPGSVGGTVLKNPAVRAVGETLIGSGTAAGATIASGGDSDDALLSASISAVSGGLVRRGGRNSKPPTRAEQRAFNLGQKAKAKVKSAKRHARNLTAAAMIGRAKPTSKDFVPKTDQIEARQRTEEVTEQLPPKAKPEPANRTAKNPTGAEELELDRSANTPPQQKAQNNIDQVPAPKKPAELAPPAKPGGTDIPKKQIESVPAPTTKPELETGGLKPKSAEIAPLPQASKKSPKGAKPKVTKEVAEVADELIRRLDEDEATFAQAFGKKTKAKIKENDGDYVGSKEMGIDVDEPLAVGAEGVKHSRSVQRAIDPHNRQLLESVTNQRTKHTGFDPREIGRKKLPSVSVEDDPSVLLTRRFSEVDELQEVFDLALSRSKFREIRKPTEIKAEVNKKINYIIRNDKGPAATKVRAALSKLGFEYMDDKGWRMTTKKNPK